MSAHATLLARLRRSTRPAAWALGLALLLLWAQWAGLVHRFEHAARLHGPAAGMDVAVQAVAGTGDETGSEGHAPAESYHSCVLFDGLHLADALPAVPPALPEVTDHGDAQGAARFASWPVPCALPFLSRAPPPA